ncbi:O-antigen ligase family protein [Weissella koreensis]|uniref:Polysaccharide polymerase n=2 Tax=Weissella koreensis TaxID=165096 RepID=A0A7H1MLD3_9LACO|nr:O-antigen ligase family protein [Weissella koreensis]AVH75065.1 hypothetical protein C4597_03085 [Weissella koreensis]QGN20291.1 hypothetical protein GKC51_03070 [Weissella koreensis]QNT64269.1 hypothetical protein FY536_02790 [Weissella koreensis]
MQNDKKMVYIIGVLFCIMPIIDTLNGVFLGHHVSDVYRILMIFVVLLFLFVSSDVVYMQTFEMIGVLLTYLTIAVLQMLVIYHSSVPFLSDLKSLSRIMLSFLYFAYFYKANLLGLISQKDIKVYLTIISFLYALMMFIPFLMGSGLATYDVQGSGLLSAKEGIGFKGYFVEVNSLSAILMGLLVFLGEEVLSYIKIANRRNIIVNGFLFLAVLISLLLTATKTGMIFGIVYPTFLILRSLVDHKVSTKVKKNILITIVVIMILAWPSIIPTLSNSVNGLVSRGMYFYQQMDGNIVQFITSNRSNFVRDNFNEMIQSGNFFFIHFLGTGYYSNPQNVLMRRVVTEMDIFDFYFSYGLIGCLVYINYFKESFKNFWNRSKDSVSWMLVTMFVYSMFGGHVFVNAMSSSILAIAYAYFVIDDSKGKEALE